MFQYMNRGITLFEILISVAILSILSTVVWSIGRDMFSYNKSVSDSLTASFEGGQAVQDFVREIRSAGQSVTGSFPIVEAGTSSITFYADLDGDAVREEIRYFLEGNALKKRTIKPSGNPPAYVLAQASVKTVVRDLSATSTPIFTYYSGDFASSSSSVGLLSQPVDPNRIRLVRINILIERDPNRSPVPLRLQNHAVIRNLKDNL